MRTEVRRFISALMISFATLSLFAPFAFAQSSDTSSGQSDTFGNFEVGLPGGSAFRKGQSIDQFIQGASNAPIKTLVNYMVTFAIGILVIIGVITIVIGGYLYMTAAGNASQVSSAKEMITSALIGIFIAFISVVILNTINPYLGSKAVEPTIPSPSGSPGAIINSSSDNSTSNGGNGAGSNSASGNSSGGGSNGSNTSGGTGDGSAGSTSGTSGNNNSSSSGSANGDNGSQDQGTTGSEGTNNGSTGTSSGPGGGSAQTTNNPPYVRVLVDNGQYYTAGPTGGNYKPATLEEVTALAKGTATGGENGIRVKVFQTDNGVNTNAISSLKNALSTEGFTSNQISGF